MSNTTLNGVRLLRDYRLERQHVFQSEGALTWFVRQNKARLIETHALVLIGGRWFVEPVAFDAYVMQQGQESASRRA